VKKRLLIVHAKAEAAAAQRKEEKDLKTAEISEKLTAI
jgi:hypothetical protein